jgi:tetratricopeptide (TPR) repeat protein
VGTLDYMAPEQARAEAVDHRADIYAFGLILSDMLIGRRKIGAGATALASLLDRISKPPSSIRATDPSIPQELDEIVLRCVQTDPALRYQRTPELLIDLEAFAGESAAPTHASTRAHTRAVPTQAAPRATTITISLPSMIPQGRRQRWVAAALLAVAVVAGGLAVYRVLSGRGTTGTPTASVAAPTGQSVSLAILPFRNASGDDSLEWLGSSLAETLQTEVGQSSALRTVSSARVSQILSDLKITRDSTLDPAALKRLAEFSSADTVLWGQYVKFGNEIRIDATLQDVKHDRTVPLKAQATSQADLLNAIGRLAASVRENLSLADGVVKELAATSFKPSTTSVTALRFYNEGLNLARQERHFDAVKKFEASTQEDPRFALAYSKLAQTYSMLGNATEAEKFSRTAVGLADALPRQEKYLVLGTHAAILHDSQKAIEYYENAEKVLKENDDVLFALATLRHEAGELDKAREKYNRLLARDEKHVGALLGAALLEVRTGNQNKGLEHLNRALTLTIQGSNEEARARVLFEFGLSYRTVGKPEDAVRYFQEALAIDRKLEHRYGIALDLHGLAETQSVIGQRSEALKNYRASLQLKREIADTQGIGNILIDMANLHLDGGAYDEALTELREAIQIQRSIGNEQLEAVALNNISDIYRARGDYEQERTYLERALTLRQKFNAPSQIAESLHNLAENQVRVGANDTALGQYLKALDLRRQIGDKSGIALELHSIGNLYEYQGRYGAARDSHAEAIKTYRETGERGIWLARLLVAQASTLIAAGQSTEAKPSLDEAAGYAKQLQNDELTAQLEKVFGDDLFYRADYQGARARYQRSLEIARRGKVRMVELSSRLGLAKIDIAEGRSQAAIGLLKKLASESTQQGLKYFAAESNVCLGEALLTLKQPGPAQGELDAVLTEAERLGALVLRAKTHYLLARVAEGSGNVADARRHSDNAHRVVEELRREARTDDVLKRADLKPLSGRSGG